MKKIKQLPLIILLILIITIVFNCCLNTTNASSVTTSNVTSDPLIFKPQVPGLLTQIVFNDNSTGPIAETIKTIFEYGIKVIALLALIVTIIGGFLWSIAGGNGQKVGEAKQWIFSGLGGLMIILFSYVLLNTINPALVNLKTSTIKSIGKLNLIYENKSDPNQFHEDSAQRTMTLASSTDPNGKIGCCIINFRPPTVAYEPISRINTNTLNCASYQATYLKGGGATNSVENLCKQFYEHSANSSVNVQYVATSNEARQISNNSAIIFPGRCEEATEFQEICMGRDHPNYCEVKGTGSSCITIDNFWGYCDNQNECIKCKNYGEIADHGYQCPSALGVKDPNTNKYVAIRNLSSSPNVQGHKCGNNNGGCITNIKKCKCYGLFCYDECITNNGNEGHWGLTISFTDRETCTKYNPTYSVPRISIPNCSY